MWRSIPPSLPSLHRGQGSPGPLQPGGRRGPSPAGESWEAEPLRGHQEPIETLSTMLIKHENTISWLINQGKTPPFISEQNPKAFYKHVTWLSVKLREVVKNAQHCFYYLTSATSSVLTAWQMFASCIVPKYTETVMRKQRLTQRQWAMKKQVICNEDSQQQLNSIKDTRTLRKKSPR